MFINDLLFCQDYSLKSVRIMNFVAEDLRQTTSIILAAFSAGTNTYVKLSRWKKSIHIMAERIDCQMIVLFSMARMIGSNRLIIMIYLPINEKSSYHILWSNNRAKRKTHIKSLTQEVPRCLQHWSVSKVQLTTDYETNVIIGWQNPSITFINMDFYQ